MNVMNKAWVKQQFKGVKIGDLDILTAREVMTLPIGHLFGVKMYVSDLRAHGCLRVTDEEEEITLFELASGFSVPAPEGLKRYMRNRRYCLRVIDEVEETT